jgi:tetratricopeptide (TPR) repeat protein
MELDPGTSSGYTNLARMLVAQQKMDEARQVFEKLIAAMPRDPQPHMNLASLLSGLKQFEGAAREYAAAAEIKPDDAAIQLSLGKAYLESGQTDKAVDALDRALARDGAALMRNNVAWALAEKNVRIDKAQPLAESAVASLEGQLRDIQVTDLDVKDLRAVSLLGSAWDTLGWVYFEQGDPEKAEKFLLAAWNLDQHNLMADHLGQLYEKQGRTRLATQYYALAEAVAPFAHARERLLALLGSQADANVQLAKARNGLASSRTLSVSTGKPRVKRESAEFFVGVSADGKASWTRFISGDASLKLGAGGLLRSKVGEAVPDGAPITLVRRGILSCSAGTAPCQFVLLLPSDVKTLD